MPGSEGLTSCVGGCNSKVFKSGRVHRPLVGLRPEGNIHLNKPYIPNLTRYERHLYHTTSYVPPSLEDRIQSPVILPRVPNVKKSRKRRDRKRAAAAVELPQDETITIDDDSDNVVPSKSYRPLFWFFGILIVLIGIGVLVYTIVIVSTSAHDIAKQGNKPWTSVYYTKRSQGNYG